MSANSAVVAVDVGTSAVRAALVDADAGVVRSVRVARASSVGGEVFDALALLAEVEQALAELDAVGGAHTVAALAISAHIGTVPVDDLLAPVAPGGGWADTRGVTLLGGVAKNELEDLLAAAGRPTVMGGALAVALDLRASGLASRVSSLLSPKDFLVARLTGRLVTDTINAAYTLASDVRRLEWQARALDLFDVPANWFPPQAASQEVAATLLPDAAARCRLPAGLPVVAGGPDGSVGIGFLLGATQGAIADVAGTTDVVGRLVSDVEGIPAGAVANPALVPGRWTAGGATGMTGGAVANWRLLVGAVSDAALAAVEPGSRGLRVIPTMSGERFPRWRADTRGAVLGRTPDHGAPELLRATQEGATFVVREGVDLLDPGREMPLIFAGGSARSMHVAHLRAAALGRTVRVASDPDVTLLGAAGLALVGVGLAGDLDDARERLGVTFHDVEPDAISVARYDAVFAEWLDARRAATSR
ncbi:FGGY-family carbohydrate kinase [Microbacterium sp. NPDC055910]|uniref:xylulokinase n=1 Tax=Microbacterium sp. NPDC055910 TaxID=3345659 RepID=UPI0035DC7C89